MGQANPLCFVWFAATFEIDFSPVRRRGSFPSAALGSGGAPNYAPSPCSVAGLLVAKWVPPTRTPSAFPLESTSGPILRRRALREPSRHARERAERSSARPKENHAPNHSTRVQLRTCAERRGVLVGGA